MRTFIFLNLWAFILDIGALLLVVLGIIIDLHPIAVGVGGLLLVFIIIKAVELHSSIGRRYRARTVLLAKNRHYFDDASFEQFMSAPCGRMMVYDVLCELGCRWRYRIIRKKYYKGFFAGERDSSLVIIPYPADNHRSHDGE